jgi:hypothetical protein
MIMEAISPSNPILSPQVEPFPAPAPSPETAPETSKDTSSAQTQPFDWNSVRSAGPSAPPTPATTAPSTTRNIDPEGPSSTSPAFDYKDQQAQAFGGMY